MSATTINRRQILGSLAALPLAAPLATILADPKLARAAAEGLEAVSLTTAGGRKVSGVLARPDATPAPAVLLVHEWWGLNDQIKAVAAEFAREGFLALAVDLYGGGVAGNADEARALMQQVEDEAATDTLASWVDWLRASELVSERVGTVGWCFGGGWSLAASLARPVEATVVYYGRVNRPASELAALKGPVLGHFATRDGFINAEMVGGFEAAMATAGKALETHWYVADHAFANPSGGRYDEEDAALSWARTLAFLTAHLKG
jgi:carboxymethylenebutenolidase